MPTAFGRARARGESEARKGGGSGDYLSNDDLTSSQIPFGIRRVKLDEGGGYKGEDRWLLSVYTWYEGEEFTNEKDTGFISMRCHGRRDPVMEAFQEALEDEDTIGPAVMVKLKVGSYNRWLDIVEWDEASEKPILGGSQVADDDEEEEDETPPARRARGSASGARSRDARPARGRAEPEPEDDDEEEPQDEPPARSTRRREAEPAPARRRSAAANPPEPAGAEAQPERETSAPSSTEVRSWARKQGYQVSPRGRVSAEIVEAYYKAHAPEEESEEEPEPTQATPMESAVDRRPKRQEAPPPDAPRGRANPIPTEGGANPNAGTAAQEVTYKPTMTGIATKPCPQCGRENIEGRIFPHAGGSGYAIIHADCPKGEAVVLDASPG